MEVKSCGPRGIPGGWNHSAWCYNTRLPLCIDQNSENCSVQKVNPMKNRDWSLIIEQCWCVNCNKKEINNGGNHWQDRGSVGWWLHVLSAWWFCDSKNITKIIKSAFLFVWRKSYGLNLCKNTEKRKRVPPVCLAKRFGRKTAERDASISEAGLEWMRWIQMNWGNQEAQTEMDSKRGCKTMKTTELQEAI